MGNTDYRKALESVLDNCMNSGSDDDFITRIILDESIPFEMFEKYGFKGGKLISLAMRSDCPDKYIIEACRTLNDGNDAYRFFTRKSDYGHHVPDKGIEEILKRRLWKSVAYYNKLPDRFRREYIKRIMTLDENGDLNETATELYADGVLDFMCMQDSMPDDCWPLLDKLAEVIRRRVEENRSDDIDLPQAKQVLMFMKIMRVPLTDTTLEESFKECEEYAVCWDKGMDAAKYVLSEKAACNPSISDYGMMQLLVRCSKYANEINQILAKSEPKRNEYRKEHGHA